MGPRSSAVVAAMEWLTNWRSTARLGWKRQSMLCTAATRANFHMEVSPSTLTEIYMELRWRAEPAAAEPCSSLRTPPESGAFNWWLLSAEAEVRRATWHWIHKETSTAQRLRWLRSARKGQPR